MIFLDLNFIYFCYIFSEESKSDVPSFSSQTANIPQSLALLFLGHEYLGK